MTATTETEPRAPESSVQPSAGKSAADPPSERDVALFRIASFYPELKTKVTDWTCSVVDRMSETLDGKGVDCLADTVEFAERWTPARKTPHETSAVIDGAELKRPGIMADLVQFIEDWTPDYLEKADDIREQVQHITGLVEAARLCEGSITHGSGDKNEIENYFTAVSGSIFVAASKCRRLLADMDGGPEGGAS